MAAPAALKKDDVVAYIVPDLDKANQSVSEIVPGIERSIKFLSELSKEEPPATGTWLTGDWTESCGDIPLDAWSLCCQCFLAPRTWEAMAGGTCLGHCLAAYFSCCLGPCYRAAIRKDFRAKYNIQGSAMEDLILACCCAWCISCQEAREVGLRSKGAYTVPFTSVGQPATKPAATAAPAVETMEKPAAVAAPATAADVAAVAAPAAAPTPVVHVEGGAAPAAENKA